MPVTVSTDLPSYPIEMVWLASILRPLVDRPNHGNSTCKVSRYLDFEKSEDPEHVYTLDFNLTYNPYCGYSPAFRYAIFRKEDHLDFAVTAGDKEWHD